MNDNEELNLFRRELISVDLPTLERPAKAISGSVAAGNCLVVDELSRNSAEWIFICPYFHPLVQDQ